MNDDARTDLITLFLCGDVMTGRGIDQILPYPNHPRIYERYMRDARGYVRLAEEANGPVEHPVPFSYIWGDALEELARVSPDVRIINLETGITANGAPWPGKSIHYRMHPRNVPCLTVAGIDCCALANNHVLDWGYQGLLETLDTLEGVAIQAPGAGKTGTQAASPAVIEVAGKGRVLVFSFGSTTSGIPRQWAAQEEQSGINLLPDLSMTTVAHIRKQVGEVKRQSDIVVASIHWGGNWAYSVPREQREFAHALIDVAGVDLIHGHSSHHVKGMEVYRDKLILYGCGDFLSDYEGIEGYEAFRDDLGLMYFPTLDPGSGKLLSLRMAPTEIRKLRVNYASRADACWLRDLLNLEGERFGTGVILNPDNTLTLIAR